MARQFPIAAAMVVSVTASNPLFEPLKAGECNFDELAVMGTTGVIRDFVDDGENGRKEGFQLSFTCHTEKTYDPPTKITCTKWYSDKYSGPQQIDLLQLTPTEKAVPVYSPMKGNEDRSRWLFYGGSGQDYDDAYAMLKECRLFDIESMKNPLDSTKMEAYSDMENFRSCTPAHIMPNDEGKGPCDAVGAHTLTCVHGKDLPNGAPSKWNTWGVEQCRLTCSSDDDCIKGADYTGTATDSVAKCGDSQLCYIQSPNLKPTRALEAAPVIV